MIYKIYLLLSDKLIKFFHENLKWVIALFLLNVPYLIHVYNIMEKIRPDLSFLFSTIFQFIFSMFVQTAILYFIIEHLPKIIQWLIFVLSGILFVIDCFTLYNYKSTLNKAMIQILLETNINEAKEYLLAYVDGTVILYIVIALILSAVLMRLGTSIFNWLLKNRLHFLRMLIILFIWSALATGYLYKTDSLDMIKSEISIARFGKINDYKKIYSKVENAKIELTYNHSDIPYVIFILGESTQRGHMQIYGYNKNTTPNLQKRLDNGEIAMFTDTISPQSTTTLSLERIFTFYRNGANEPWYEYINIFDILQGGGV